MIFLDTAKPEEIQKWSHLISGVTCNPLILSRERPGVAPMVVLQDLIDASDREVSFQVWSDDENEMRVQAGRILEVGAIVKLPLTATGIRVASHVEETTDDGDVPVNFTGIMTPGQVLIAYQFRAKYASLFWGRASKLQLDPFAICASTAKARHLRTTSLLVGSIRDESDVLRAFDAGADIVTVQPAVLERLIHHDRTESTIAEFLEAFRGSR